MKKNWALMLLMSLAAAVTPLHAKDYHYTTVADDAMSTRIYTLDNGLKVYMSVNKEKPRVQANIAVRTGSRNDPAETTGLAHYLEHLMFKGTKLFGTTDYAKEKPYLDDIKARYEVYRKLTDPAQRKQAYHEIDSVSQIAAKYNIPNEYDKLMAALGSEGSNAFTSNDITCYVENVPNNELENWMRVQSDRFQNMIIRGFHTELEAVYEEKNIGMADDMDKEFAAIGKLLFPTHPYGTQTTIGEQEHLKNPSIVNIENYFNRYYRANNVAIVLAGDFDPDATIALIDKYFGSWASNPTLSRPEYENQPYFTSARDTSVVGLDAENVLLAWKTPGANSHEADTLDLVYKVLSNGAAGLIDVNLNMPMKVGGAEAFCEEMHDYSTLMIYALPKEQQTLEEARALLVAEVEKLRKGAFDEDLISAIMANKKLEFYKSLDNNSTRARMMEYAFVNDQDWGQVAHRLKSQESMTKAQLVAFANRWLGDNYSCVYKRLGNDTTLKKIEKPAITPIPANREYQSQFLTDIVNTKVPAINPVFVDYEKDLTVTKTQKGLPLLYKQNTQDDLFTLSFRYDFGSCADLKYGYAGGYLNYIGTDKKTVAEINKELYALACRFSVRSTDLVTNITISGLNENIGRALAIVNDKIAHAKADQESWNEFVSLILKNRDDAKKEQRSCFTALYDYGVYGKYNSTLNDWSAQQLRAQNPQEVVDVLKNLANLKHDVIYYGPATVKTLNDLLNKEHKTAKKLANVPANKEYMEQTTPANEIVIAPYDAKNIYLRMYHNEGRKPNVNELATAAVFNEYFGGGMNTIVFQELRETRGLAYNANAYYSDMPRKGHCQNYRTHIISQTDKMMDCINVFHDILNNMPQNEAAFNLAKQNLKKSIEAGRTTKMAVINSYLNNKQLGIDFNINKKIYEQIDGVTLQDIINFEKQNMANKTYRYIILGDEKNLDIEALEKIAPVKRLTLEEIFGY